MKPGCGLKSVAEQAQALVETAVGVAAAQAVDIAKRTAEAIGNHAGHRLAAALSYTAADAATKAATNDLVHRACRLAAADGMKAIHIAGEKMGLSEDAVDVARQEVAMGSFQRHCVERVERMTPVHWAQHQSLIHTRDKVKAFVLEEASARAGAAGEQAALREVQGHGNYLKHELGRMAAWHAHQSMLRARGAARAPMLKASLDASLKAAVASAQAHAVPLMRAMMHNATIGVEKPLVKMLDLVALDTVQDTVEETALEAVWAGTTANANHLIRTGVARQLFDEEVAQGGVAAESQAYAAAEEKAAGDARKLTSNPEAFDMVRYARNPDAMRALTRSSLD